jgi:hypothetical protein
MKPVVTVSFSGYDKLISDVGVIGRLGGNPNLGKGFEMVVQMMTRGKGLAGLDAKRPWGVVLLTDGHHFTPYGFLPVTDLKQLVEVAKQNPQLEEKITLTDGVYEIQAGDQTNYMVQKGKWAVLAHKSEDLAHAPPDPLALLGDLPKRYDLAYRASLKNLPDEYHEQLLAQLQAGIAMGMARTPDESDAQYNGRVFGFKQAHQNIVTLINEAEELTIGWTIDVDAGTSYLDFEVKARSGTDLAKQFAAMKPGKTNFAGFLMPEAAATANWAGTLTDADVARANSALATIHKAIAKELDNQGLPEEGLKQATHLLDEMVGIVEKNIEKKQSDGGAAVLLGPATLTIVGGSVVADGAEVDKLLKELVEEMRKSEPKTADSIKLNAETYQGIRFHTLSVPTPTPELKPLLGDTLEVVVGVGDNQLLVAAGRDAAKTLERVIDGSKAAAGKEVPPMEIKLSAATIAKFIAQVAEDEEVKARVEMISSILEKAGKKDHVILTTKPIPQGVCMRLELEQGLLKALGSLASIYLPGPPPQGAVEHPATPSPTP